MLTLMEWMARFFPDQPHDTHSLEFVRLIDAFEAAYRAGYAHGLAVAQDLAEAASAWQEENDATDHA